MARTSATPVPSAFVQRGATHRIRPGKLVEQATTYALVLLVGSLLMGPFLFTLGTSLKAPDEIFLFPPRFFPREWRWANYLDAWTQARFSLFYTNTAIVTILTMVGQITSAMLVAYGFARFRFPGRDALFLLVLATVILPEEVTIIPSFLLYKQLGLLDTWWPLIVPHYFGGGAIAIFLLRQFFLTLPRDMDEAAEIDGAGSLRILVEIIAPLSRPAIATLAIFSFVGRWNDFFHPLIYLNTTENFTISLGLRFYQQVAFGGGPVRDHLLIAAALTATVPMVVVFLIFQRHFVRGLAFSGLRG